MNWYFIEQKASFLEQVFPQWKPMKVSFRVYVEFALDALFVHILRNAVVDIQQGNGILADAGSDELAECSVDIYLTGYRDSSVR